MDFLTALYTAFFADPLYYIGVIFALWGAWGFGLFIAGLANGLPHLFTFGESDDHMEHARVHIVQGLYLTMTAFGAWEIVRVIAGAAPWGYLWLSFIMLLPLWLPWLLRGGKPAGGGGH